MNRLTDLTKQEGWVGITKSGEPIFFKTFAEALKSKETQHLMSEIYYLHHYKNE